MCGVGRGGAKDEAWVPPPAPTDGLFQDKLHWQWVPAPAGQPACLPGGRAAIHWVGLSTEGSGPPTPSPGPGAWGPSHSLAMPAC